MLSAILEQLSDAYDRPDEVAWRHREAGGRVVRTVGADVPRELLLAAGLHPVRLEAALPTDAPRAQRNLPADQLASRTRSLLEQALSMPDRDLLVLSHADAQLPQLFAILRELARLGESHLESVHFIDLLHAPESAAKQYNVLRLSQLRAGLEAATRRPISAAAVRVAIAATNEQRGLLTQVRALRIAAQLTGVHVLKIIGSAAVLPVSEHVELLRELLEGAASLARVNGRRVYVTGSNHATADFYALLESCGALVVGEEHDYGERWCATRLSGEGEPLEALAEPAHCVPRTSRSWASRRELLAASVAQSKPDAIIHVCLPDDESAPWETNDTRSFCKEAGLPLLVLQLTPEHDRSQLRMIVQEFIDTPVAYRDWSAMRPAGAQTAPAQGSRSRKSLRSVGASGEYQRVWFAQLRERVAAGEPLAVVNADAPQEILRALDIPFVVNQWWASIVAAKQQSTRYLELLRSHGYPTDCDAYSAQGLAATFDEDTHAAPWGGLPRPRFLLAMTSTDGAPKLFDAWARAAEAQLHLFQRTVDARWSLPSSWWDELPARWDEALEPERLDLLVEELQAAIVQLERATGRVFSRERFAQVMQLVNEQEAYYRRTRDLIARTIPAPAGIVDTMPATMVPQWHRGTQWGRDAARAFYEEVAERVARGDAACANERIRLMWIGRGMWSEMGFYQRWESSHGAVFVWSMYLALAADGYIREFDRNRDPLRALAARIVTMGDELRMPTWAAAWHVHEAQTHGVDGAVALSDADPFVLRALERAGIPLLALPLDNFNHEGVDRNAIERMVTDFIEGPVNRHAAQRRGPLSTRD